MREPILRAVAMPPRIFLAPFIPAVANFVIQGAVLFLCLALFDTNPLVFVFTIVIVHFILIVAGTKEPHLSHMSQAWGLSGPTSSRNIYKSKGVKMAP